MTQVDFSAVLGNHENTPKYSKLVQLSGLSLDELSEFKTAWLPLTQPRRHEIMKRLVELCEDNLELDFSAIFKLCLEDDNDENVRETATLGLWDYDDRTIIRPIIELLQSDPSAKVRAATAIVLGKFAEMAQNGKLISRDSDRILEALMAAINEHENDPEVRRRAIEAAANFDTPEIVKIIQEAYEMGDTNFKQSAIYAMGQSSNIRWLPTILEELESKDAAVRYESANACGQLGDESNAPLLIPLIEDHNLQVQQAAIRALGMIGGPLSKHALKQCLKMGDEVLEMAAADALSRLEVDDDPMIFKFET